MRVDANVSVRQPGDEFGTRCEIKNLNSLRSLVRAIEYEIGRQVALLEAGGTVAQQTRHWDEDQRRTGALRSKEEAFDYRYFPEPDLVRVVPDAGWQADVAAAVGDMPADRRRRVGRAARTGRVLGSPQRPGGHGGRTRPRRPHGHGRATAASAPPWLWPGRPTRRRPNRSGPGPSIRPRYTALLRMEQDGSLSATQAKVVLRRPAGERRRPGRTGPQPGLRGAGRGLADRRDGRAHRRPPR